MLRLEDVLLISIMKFIIHRSTSSDTSYINFTTPSTAPSFTSQVCLSPKNRFSLLWIVIFPFPFPSCSRPGTVPRSLASDRVPQQHGGRQALEEGNDLRLPCRPLRRHRQPSKVFRGPIRADRGATNLLRFRDGSQLNGEPLRYTTAEQTTWKTQQ